jgi:hypothetical protein
MIQKDPINFLQKNKKSIIRNLINNLCPEEKVELYFQETIICMRKLEEYRISKDDSEQIIDALDRFDGYAPNTMKLWIFNAIYASNKHSYKYAYTKLKNFFSEDSFHRFPENKINHNELTELLILEETQNTANTTTQVLSGRSPNSHINMGLSSNLSTEQATELCNLLKGEYISPETLETNFAAVFTAKPLPIGFTTVVWVKKQKRNKLSINKKAVFDLLKLTGVDLDNTDLPTINNLICGDLKHSNWNGNKGTKTESEAYPDLKHIISLL